MVVAVLMVMTTPADVTAASACGCLCDARATGRRPILALGRARRTSSSSSSDPLKESSGSTSGSRLAWR
jgi:hypothetical protein